MCLRGKGAPFARVLLFLVALLRQLQNLLLMFSQRMEPPSLAREVLPKPVVDWPVVAFYVCLIHASFHWLPKFCFEAWHVPLHLLCSNAMLHREQRSFPGGLTECCYSSS